MADTLTKNELYHSTQNNLKKLLEVAFSSEIKCGQPLDDPQILQRIHEMTSAINDPLDNCYAMSLLFKACSEGNCEEVKNQIISGCDVNEIGADGETALACAINANHFQIVELLLQSGADPNCCPVKIESTHLMDATNAGYVDIVRVLLEFEANVDVKSKTNNSALHYAACGGHTDCCKLILAYSKNRHVLLEEQNDNGHTALMEAAISGFIETTKFLVENGALINATSTEFKETALTLASYKGCSDIVQYLLEAGADHEHRTDEMHTALMEAAMEGHIDATKVLLYYGAQVNMRADSFESPLTLAACSGHCDLTACLINYGADIEEVNDESYTPLMEAAREGHLETVAMLLSLGADINRVTDETQETALTLAACGGFYDIVLLLHRCGGDIELGASTPLMESALEGHLGIVKALLMMGASVDATNSSDETSLHLASENGHMEVCRYLLDHGADVHHVSEGGRTSLMKACRAGYLDVVLLLMDRGSRVDQMTTAGDHNALSLAVANGHCKIVEYLLRIGADPTVKLNDNSTVLIEASRAGHLDVIEILLRDTKHDARLLLAANNNNITNDTMQQLTNHYLSTTITNNNAPNLYDINKFINYQQSQHLSCVLPCSLIGDVSSDNIIFSKPQSLPANIPDPPMNPPPSPPALLQSSSPSVNNHNLDDWVKYICPNLDSIVSDEPMQIMLPDNHFHRKIKKAKHSDNYPSQLESNWIPHRICTNNNCQNHRMDTNKSEHSINSNGYHHLVSMNNNQITNTDVNHTSQNCNTFFSPYPSKDELQTAFTHPMKHNLFLPNNQTGSLPVDKTHIVPLPISYSISHDEYQTDIKRFFSSATPTNTSPIKPLITNLATPTTFHKQVLQPKRRLHQNQRSPVSNQLSQSLGSDCVVKLTSQPNSFLIPTSESSNFNFPEENLSIEDRNLFFQQSRNDTSGIVVSSSDNSMDDNLESVEEIDNVEDVGDVDDDDDAADFDSDIGMTNCRPAYCCTKENCKRQLSVNVCTESSQESPLSLACSGGHIEVVKLLINSGAKLDHRDKKSQTALHVAVLNGHLKVVKILLESGVDKEAMIERTKDTALSIACANGKLDIIAELVTNRANIEHRNISDYTPLGLAASAGHTDVIKYLLKNNAEINARTNSKLGISPLMLAAMNGYYDAVVVLLDHGSDINAQIETNRNTALTLACYQGRDKVVALLIERNAYIEHRAKSGLTPLMEAASQGHVAVGQLLIKAGADVNAAAVQTSRDTALITAAEKGHTDFVRLLLQHNAVIDAHNKKGDTPLWLACYGGYIDVVRLLIDAVSDTNCADNKRITCLMVAFKKGHVKVVQELVTCVTQFPTLHDCIKHIKSIKNEDKDLLKKCEACKDIILQAKERQETEAAKNAKDLLKLVEEENKAKEHKEVKQAKKREKKKAKKKSKHDVKDVEIVKSEELDEKIIEDVQTSNNNENINPKSNKRSRLKQKSDKSDDHDEVKEEVTDQTNSWIQINSNKIVSATKIEENNWQKIGGSKKKLDIQVNKKDIGKVIGQGGSVVNAIRYITSAHIDIDSMVNDADERTVHLKGTLESVSKARDYICDLVDGTTTGNAVIKESEPYATKAKATLECAPVSVPAPQIPRQNGKTVKSVQQSSRPINNNNNNNNMQYGFSKQSTKTADFASVAASGLQKVKTPEHSTLNDSFPSLSETSLEQLSLSSPLEVSTVGNISQSNSNISKSFALAPGSERSLHQRTYNSTPEHSPQMDYSGRSEKSTNHNNNNNNNNSPVKEEDYIWSRTTFNQESMMDFESINQYPKMQHHLNPKAEAFSPLNVKSDDFYFGAPSLNPTANIFMPRVQPQPPMVQEEQRLIRLQDHINMAINILLRNNGFDHNMAEAAFASFMRSANLDLNTRLTTTEFTALINNVISQSTSPPPLPFIPPAVPVPQVSPPPQLMQPSVWPMTINSLNSQSIWAPNVVSNGLLSHHLSSPPFFPLSAQAAFNSPLLSSFSNHNSHHRQSQQQQPMSDCCNCLEQKEAA